MWSVGFACLLICSATVWGRTQNKVTGDDTLLALLLFPQASGKAIRARPKLRACADIKRMRQRQQWVGTPQTTEEQQKCHEEGGGGRSPARETGSGVKQYSGYHWGPAPNQPLTHECHSKTSRVLLTTHPDALPGPGRSCHHGNRQTPCFAPSMKTLLK